MRALHPVIPSLNKSAGRQPNSERSRNAILPTSEVQRDLRQAKAKAEKKGTKIKKEKEPSLPQAHLTNQSQ
jgi:hypothetical protein